MDTGELVSQYSNIFMAEGQLYGHKNGEKRFNLTGTSRFCAAVVGLCGCCNTRADEDGCSKPVGAVVAGPAQLRGERERGGATAPAACGTASFG